MPTLEEVARHAGVSKSTVSRAFGRPDLVNQATLKRIRDAAEVLSYIGPRQTRNVRHGVLAAIVPGIGLPFFSSLLDAAQAEATANQLPLLIGDAKEEGGPERDLLEAFSTRVDGIVLASSRLSDEEIRAHAEVCPIVVVNRQVDGVPGVLVTSQEGMEDAVTHLYELGHRDILYMRGAPARLASRVRSEAFEHSASQLGIRVTEIGPFAPRFEAGFNAAEMVIGSGATAVIAWNDLVALGLMVRATELGVRIGQDLSVVGFDDIWLHTLVAPALTTVAAPVGRAGAMAVRTLLDRIAGRDVPPVTLLPSSLVVRSSTGRPSQS